MAFARRLTASSMAAAVAASALLALPWGGAAQAAEAEGTPYTFGSNTFGQLGDGSLSTASRATPGPVTGLDDAIDVAGGREHLLALRADGTVMAWGSDDNGQQGNGPGNTNQYEPELVPGLTGIVDVDDGHYHSIALKDDGTAWTWGYGSFGQLGNDSTSAQVHSPVQFGSLSNIERVYGGRDMTLVLLDDGTVWCAGSNAFGECGTGATTSKVTVPIEVEGISDVVDLAGGRNHTLAIKDDGTVWAWGDNNSGQLGDGTDDNFREEPEQVAGLSNIVDVAAGADHSVAVTASGDVYTWGSGYRGQLGHGGTGDRLTPSEVPGIDNAVISEAGRDQTLIITETGSLLAWGWHEFRQAGAPSGDKVLSPVTVSGISNAIGAAGGQAYSVVLEANAPPPGPVFTDSFDAGLTEWSGGTNFSIDNDRFPATGSAPSVRANLTNQKAVATRAGLPAEVEAGACVTVMSRVESGSGTTSVLSIASEGGVNIARVIIGKNRVLKVRAEVAGVTKSSGLRVPRNQWREVGLCATQDGDTTDQVALIRDGVEIRRWTVNNGNHAIDQVSIGTRVKATAVFNLDDVAVTTD